jgi:hypothetical protein
VRVVLATHWHDDHVRGLSGIVETCAKAEFICASALTKHEFLAMVARYQEHNTIVGGSGVNEIFKVFQLLDYFSRTPTYASANRPLFRFLRAEALLGADCILTALSPSDAQLDLFWREIAELIPVTNRPKRRAVPQSPNHVATAAWLSIGGKECVLLGSDLEETTDARTGWSVIVASTLRPAGLAGVFKIPHHGSKTGYSADVWQKMLRPGAHAVLTPFIRGNVQLPTQEEADRIISHTEEAYSTSHPRSRSVRRRSQTVERTIRETVGSLRAGESRFGQVRLRKVLGCEEGWRVELFGSACRVADMYR